MRIHRLASGLVLAASMAFGSCSEPTRPAVGPAAVLKIVSGDLQAGVVGDPLSQPIVVLVLDAGGHAVAGQLVNFRVTEGGGSVFAGSALTNADGQAQEIWTLGRSTSGVQAVEARAVDATSGAALVFGVFHATALPGPAALISKESGDGQTAVVGTDVAVAPTVKIKDADGNPVPGVAVTFAVASGDGSVTGAGATSDSVGVAAVGSWTLGPTAGANSLTVTATGLTESPATFTATGTSSPKHISVDAGNNQTAIAGTAVATPPSVKITGLDGNVVVGAVVTFAVTAGGGSITAASATTNSSGIATAEGWTLGTTVGTNSLRATVPGGDSSLTFLATAVAGPPTLVSVVTGDRQQAVASTAAAVAPTVRVRDQYGNSVPGATVSFVVTAGGGSVSAPSAVTNVSGIADAGQWSFGSSPGANALEARAIGATPAAFTGTGYPHFVATSVATLSAGTCALDTAGAAFCWRGTSGPFADSLPRAVGGATFASLSSGPSASHVCAITPTADAYCWGSNTHGQLGDGTTTSAVAPVSVSGGIKFTSIVTASRASCGLAQGGSVYCWGDNGFGALGDGTTTTRNVPAPVSGTLSFMKLAAGSGHVCGLAVDSTAYCWGFSSFGQAGGTPGTLETCANGLASCIVTPTPVTGGRQFASITAGGFHSCGLTAAGAVYCWGSGIAFGRVGDSPNPALVNSAQQFVSVDAGGLQTCGINGSARAYCWGANANGELGIGNSTTPIATPTAVAGSLSWTLLSPTCGIAAGGGLWCWGAGPTGAGSLLGALSPRAVIRR